ncbi:bacteriophage lambda head decoration protein D [Tepidimonas ignava]|uniref:Bacteriophage lambda head decoration protein D n=1 Tax=Tepidimonas ignava TaxID=114249 RepID=A0A4R3LHY2_9BURK|nr:head decoration protein [Tepidimonas ignava]TCS99125.1 bacteriophage lambda head decoration protein D [Tepidimonas ignava]TSE22791.1 Bacteriophage lambda head decoration protein D [Tepidimonas ignava]
MSTLTSNPTLGDVLKRECDPDYTRETVTVKAGSAYPIGTVLGRITASGVYARSPAASTTGLEGAEIACAVLLEPVAESTTDTKALALVRGPAIVADQALVFDASVDTDAERAAKREQLAAYGIVVRTAV